MNIYDQYRIDRMDVEPGKHQTRGSTNSDSKQTTSRFSRRAWALFASLILFSIAGLQTASADSNPWADSYGRCYDYLYAPGSTSQALPVFTLQGDVCTQDEVIAKAHVIGKA